MVRNYISNDIDLVQPTKYTVSKNQVAKKPPPEPVPLPPFKPLPIYNKNEYGEPNLLDHINNNDPWQIFKLFQPDKLINQLIEYTNKNTELYPPPKDKDFPRRQKPTSRQELYAYLVVLIYIGLHIKSSIKDYQYKDFSYRTMHILRNYILANQWQQLNRYFYCTKLRSKDDKAFQNIFKRIKELSKELHFTLIKYYKPRIYLAVNKIIERFTSHAPKIINIPTKPILEGFKIWLLGN